MEAVAAEAEADRRHHRTRKRSRGDCSKGFFDDPDRFALAAMVAAQLSGEASPMQFGGLRSDWSSAHHAAALFAPGRGQHVTYSHRRVDGALIARATFRAPDRHEMAARRLTRKQRTLEGLPATWVALSGALLAQLNSSARSGTRAHARGLLGRLGWRDVPPSTWIRLGQLLAPNEINGLGELLVGDRP
ncbi:hypothetical protein ACRBEV_29630 [Methylobacterium phyllosphaerae]